MNQNRFVEGDEDRHVNWCHEIKVCIDWPGLSAEIAEENTTSEFMIGWRIDYNTCRWKVLFCNEWRTCSQVACKANA